MLAPARAEAADSFAPLIGIWRALRDEPATLARWYRRRWEAASQRPRRSTPRCAPGSTKAARPADLIYLSRAAYGGVIRFRRRDGYMSTPVGLAPPDPPRRVRGGVAAARVRGTRFHRRDYGELAQARGRRRGPAIRPTAIRDRSSAPKLRPRRPLRADRARQAARRLRGAEPRRGRRKSGGVICGHSWPAGLFEREVAVTLRASMLKRFQMEGKPTASAWSTVCC
ncbi:MAG: DNA adenine methylase [Paracoccaceae bacterium]